MILYSPFLPPSVPSLHTIVPSGYSSSPVRSLESSSFRSGVTFFTLSMPVFVAVLTATLVIVLLCSWVAVSVACSSASFVTDSTSFPGRFWATASVATFIANSVNDSISEADTPWAPGIVLAILMTSGLAVVIISGVVVVLISGIVVVLGIVPGIVPAITLDMIAAPMGPRDPIKLVTGLLPKSSVGAKGLVFVAIPPSQKTPAPHSTSMVLSAFANSVCNLAALAAFPAFLAAKNCLYNLVMDPSLA